MPIPFICPHCQHETLVEDKYAGQTGSCIECGKPITVPLANSQGAVVPQEKVDLQGGSAVGIALTCGIVLILREVLMSSSIGLLWFWWRLGW